MANRTVLEDPVASAGGGARLPAWGQEAIIDLYGCGPAALEDAGTITRFLAAVVQAIGMTAHGEPELELFGSGSLHGYSAKQWIETSSIILHMDVPGHRCFINVFSCQAFESADAAQVAITYFGGTAHVRVLQRGDDS